MPRRRCSSARAHAGEAEQILRVTLPDDPIPDADAIVSIGHVLSYLPEEAAIDRAFVAIANALRPDGVLALDICDLSYAETRSAPSTTGWVTDRWALITERSVPSPGTFVRQMAIFMRNQDGSWRRDDERHENILVDTSRIPNLLASYGVEARLGRSFGAEQLPEGLHTVIGHRPA